MSGKLKFGPIPTLPEGWWEDPDSVWSGWDRDTHYLWGANGGNYATRELGVIPEATFWPESTVLGTPDAAHAGDEGTFTLRHLNDLKTLVRELEEANQWKTA